MADQLPQMIETVERMKQERRDPTEIERYVNSQGMSKDGYKAAIRQLQQQQPPQEQPPGQPQVPPPGPVPLGQPPGPVPPGQPPAGELPPEQPPQEPEMGWGDVAQSAVRNFIPSAGNVAQGYIDMFQHPLQTLQNVGDVGAGALREGARRILPEGVFNAIEGVQGPEQQASAERASQAAEATGQHFVDDYGSMRGFKGALASDPVGVAADIASVIGGGAGAVRRLGRGPMRLPTTPELKAKTGAAYTAAKSAGNVLPVQDYRRIVSDLGKFAHDNGANPRLTPNVNSAIKVLEDRASTGQALTVQDLDQMRKTLKMGMDVMKPEERRLIQKMVDEYDKAIDSVVPPELLEARKLNQRYKKAELMDDMEANAELRAGQYSQSGQENALRSEFRKLGLNQRKMRGMTPEETEAIRRVGTGTRAQNTARMVGKLAPTSVVAALPTILGGGGVAQAFGPVVGGVAGAGIAGVGTIAKRIADKLAEGNVRKANEVIRGPGPRQRSPVGLQDAIAAALMSESVDRWGGPR